MRNLLILVTTIISTSVFASTNGGGILMRTGISADSLQQRIGGTGGGGVLASAMSAKFGSSQEIIYHMGQKDGLVKFAYGQLVDKKWQVHKIEMPEADLMVDPSVMKALQDSKDLKSWAEIR